MQNFSEIWEREGRWLMGPGLLADIVHFMRGKAPYLEADPINPSTLNLFLPLPTVRDHFSGRRSNVIEAVPEELHPLFLACLSRIQARWVDDRVKRRLSDFLGRQVRADTLARANDALQAVERERECLGEPELWQIACEEFGFGPFGITPQPAMMAS